MSENDLESKINTIIKKYLGTEIDNFGIIYYNLNLNKKVGININKNFTAGCTFYLGLYMVIHEEIQKGNISLDEKIDYNAETDYQDGSGTIQWHINKSIKSPIMLKDLLDMLIMHSDNIARRMIVRNYGGIVNIKQKLYQLINKDYDDDINTTNTTPEIQFLLLKKVYDNQKYYSYLIEILQKTKKDDRITRFIPDEIVSHKTGHFNGCANDIGIVFSKNPYIIIFYSRDVSHQYKKIGTLSKLIYDKHVQFHDIQN